MILPTSSAGKSYPDIKGYRLVHQIGGGGFSRYAVKWSHILRTGD